MLLVSAQKYNSSIAKFGAIDFLEYKLKTPSHIDVIAHYIL